MLLLLLLSLLYKKSQGCKIAGEHSIIFRTVKYALLIVSSGRSPPHLLKQNRRYTQATSPTSLKIEDS